MNSKPINYNELGFLVSSPVLILARGRQKLKFKINFVASSYEKSKMIFEAWSLGETTLDYRSIELKKIIRDAFNLFVTSESGWLKIDHFTANLDHKKQALILSLVLSEKHNSMVPFDNEIHEGDFESEWPCVKILLNKYTKVDPYKFFGQTVVESIVIEVAVSDVTELSLSNSIGELDSSIPFAPFGPAPYRYSYLRIQNPLILTKNLTNLTINLEWSGLPISIDGFKGYYKEYNTNIENSSFKAILSTSRIADQAHYQETDEAFELFDCEDNSERLINLKRKEVNLEKLYLKTE